MIRVTDLDATLKFFSLLGLEETTRKESEKGRFTLVFLAAPGQKDVAEVELTYNWPPEDGSPAEVYTGGRNFGHLAYAVDDIYGLCQHLMDYGITINRPPRDGHMAFVRTPDGISIELLQKGGALEPREPWASMGNTGAW
ncbi:VOC family protein [Alteraurantiacibacter buctensis]|uniref:Lactoylglutathione lyase n=1 Tax=Alteraurantiacibacter buctensis TaxID=1503981 RepID=A0A844Z3X1_9SPHN|nr:VOC family protein [Alteraurantiacibacter buctensis]MXO73287.1 lactoylglutathione lyase [Alteraurantiacibacter buctensis]